MASPFLKTKIAVVLASTFLSACGGGGDAGNIAQTSAGSEGGTFLAVPSFYTYLRLAPPDGATISGIVRLEVQGGGLKNVEVLPETGDKPKYGKFILPTGGEGWLDLDTTKLPNGPLKLRIVAYDAPAGQPANQLVVMPARTWNINNPVKPGPLAVTSVSAPAAGSVVSGMRKLEVRGTGLTNVELLPASGYSPRMGVFNVNPERTYAWLELDTRTIPDGVKSVRISAFNVTQGQSGAQEILAMPARQWNFQNGLKDFTATLDRAPLDGETLSGDNFVIQVTGTNLQNVELLPQSGYTPKLGVFQIYPANINNTDKDVAILELSLKDLPKGAFTARVSAFNKPAGSSGAQEIVVMPARTWEIK